MRENEKFIFQNQEEKLTDWLRNEDTWVAKGLKRICPLEGAKYRLSKRKRFFEFVFISPLAIAASIPTGILTIASCLQEPIGHPFYRPLRIKAKDQTTRITKFRTMVDGADQIPDGLLKLTGNYSPENDPRNTTFGRIIRAYEFDELPQIYEILSGKLSLVDIRSVAPEDMEVVKKHRPKTYPEWRCAVLEGKLGAFSLNSAENKINRKHILKRQHYDLLYARRASLGLDLFILYKNVLRMTRKAEQKIRGLEGAKII